MNFLKLFVSVLDKKQKIDFYLINFFSTIIIIFELLSIGLIIPLISLILYPKNILENLSALNIKIPNYFEKILMSENNLYFFLAIFFTIFFIKNILIIYSTYLQKSFVEKIEVDLSLKLLNKYLSQKYKFFLDNKISNLISKLSIDISNFHRGFVSAIITFIAEILIVLSFVFLIIILGLGLALTIFLSLLIVTSIILKFFGKIQHKIGKNRDTYNSLKIGFLNNIFLNIKSIIFYNKQKELSLDYNHYIKKLAFYEKIIAIMKIAPRVFFEIFSILILVILIIFLTKKNLDKEVVISILAFFIGVSYRLVPSFLRIIQSYGAISAGINILNIYKRDLNLEDNNLDIKNKIPFNKKIELNNISFKHEGRDLNVLNNLDLKINKGEIIGICGESGTGKSTLVDVITYLMPANSGTIKVDDQIVNNNQLIRQWQNQISYVTQSSILFDESILKNITFTSDISKIDKGHLEKTIKNSELEKFLETLPQKINTKVGELGNQISGGQLKRILIARALFKKPEIIIFDEATNGLDKETEKNILKTIFNLKSSITIIIVSHDQNILQQTEKIYNLKKGKLEILKKN